MEAIFSFEISVDFPGPQDIPYNSEDRTQQVTQLLKEIQHGTGSFSRQQAIRLQFRTSLALSLLAFRPHYSNNNKHIYNLLLYQYV
jgi:hypothetical protein